MKRFFILFLLTASLASAQCSTHQRQFKKPWTWFESNMCELDYDAWLQDHPPHKWIVDKRTPIKALIIASALTADILTTSQGQPQRIENNPLIGPHPSNKTLVISGLFGYSAYEFCDWFSYHNSHKDPSATWRTFGMWDVPAIAASIHVPLAVHNYELDQGCVYKVNGKCLH